MIPLAGITGNSLILLAVLVMLVFAVAYSLMTVKGSGISLTRRGGDQSAPGAKGPSEPTGVDHGEGSATGSDADSDSDPQHGAQ